MRALVPIGERGRAAFAGKLSLQWRAHVCAFARALGVAPARDLESPIARMAPDETGCAERTVFLIIPSSRAEKYPDGRSCRGVGYAGGTAAASASGDSGMRLSKRFAARIMGVAARQIASNGFICVPYHYISSPARGMKSQKRATRRCHCCS